MFFRKRTSTFYFPINKTPVDDDVDKKVAAHKSFIPSTHIFIESFLEKLWRCLFEIENLRGRRSQIVLPLCWNETLDITLKFKRSRFNGKVCCLIFATKLTNNPERKWTRKIVWHTRNEISFHLNWELVSMLLNFFLQTRQK